MEGPFLKTKDLKYKLALDYSERYWYVPAAWPESSSSSSHLANREDTSVQFVYRQPKWRRVWSRPLPYDTYGVREKTRFSFALSNTWRHRNITTWVSPYWQYRYWEFRLSGACVNPVMPPIPKLPKRDREGPLISAALEKANTVTVNLTVAAAEANKTLGMFDKRIKQLDRAIRHIRKGQFSRAAKALQIRTPKHLSRTKHWADNFLEYSYGWVPVIMDVCGSAQFLAEFLRTSAVLVVSAREEVKKDPVVSTQVVTLYPPHDQRASYYRHSATIIQRDKTLEHHSVSLGFALEGDLLYELSKLGALNPLLHGYERIPLSFVLDWFANVSQVLASFTVYNGLRFLGGCYSQSVRVNRTVELGSVNFPTPFQSGEEYVSSSASSTSGEYESWVMRRYVYDALPPPELYIALPQSRQLQKAAVSAALLRQRFS